MYDCSHQRVPVIGHLFVGKTSITNRIISNSFFDTVSTTGVQDQIKSYIRNGQEIKVQFWDTAGQERFRSLIPSFLRGAQCVLIVYSIIDEDSFNSIDEFRQLVEELVENPNSKIILCANKEDLRLSYTKPISKDRGQELANKYGWRFVSVSAKTGLGIEDLENDILQIIMDGQTNQIVTNTIQDIDSEKKKESSQDCC